MTDLERSVSVVVPVRNGAATIALQLEALANQDYDGHWEVVVSDNGSTDATRSVVEEWSPKLPGLRVVDSSQARGVAHARNVGVAAAVGRLILICDSDDVAAPSWIRLMVAAGRPGAVVVGANDYDQLNEPIVRQWADLHGVEDPDAPPYLGFLPYGGGGNFGVDRAVWEAIDGWDERLLFAEDIDFSWRAQLAGYRLVTAPEAVVHYRLRPTMWGLTRQALNWGRGEAELYALHRANGFRRRRLRHVARAYASIARRAPRALLSRPVRGRWCRDLAWRVGRLYGSARQRVWFP